MAIVIKPKRSETADSAPGTSDIVDGEIAVNIADKKIYIRHSDDTIVTLSDGANLTSGSTSTIDATTDIILDADGGDIFFKDGGTTFGSATNTSGNLIVKSGTTTALTFSGANVTAAGTIDSGAITSTGVVTGTGFTIGSAAINETELEIIDGATVTTTELNLLDGGTSVGDSITIADADGFIVNDNGTMKSIPASDIKTYAGGSAPAADDIGTGDAAVNITTSSGNITIDAAANNSDIIFKGTDASSDITMLTLDGSEAGAATFNSAITGGGLLTTGGNIVIPNAGNIGSAGDTDAIAIASDGVVTFSQNPVGTLATAAQTNITSLGTLTALTVDDVNINGKVITMTGSSSDTAVFTAGTNGTLSIVTTDDAAAAANIQITADGTAELAGTTVTLDSSGGITLDADNGTITFADAGSSLGTITSDGYTGNVVGNVTGNVTGNTSGTAATVTGAAQTNITSLGTLTALTVDDVNINGKVITMTGSSSDTAVFTAGTNGTLSIVTTDDSAAAANIQITADGTAELAGTTVTLDSSGGITLDADNGTITFADAGSSLGTITSDGYTGNVVGNVTGNTSGTAATVTGAAQTNITSLGTLTALTVDDVAINGKVMTMTGSSSDTAVFTVGTNGTLSIVTTDDAAAAANITITADGTFEADGTTVTLDSGGDIVLDADGGDVFFKDGGTTFGSATNTSGNLIVKSGTTTALTFSGANVTAAGTIDSGAITSTGVVTGTGFTIGSAAINETELEIIDGATVTTTELNLLDGGTAVGDSITIADADGFIVNDNGTMKSIPASDVKTYAGGNPAADDIATGDAAVTITTSSGNITIDAAANNSDIIFKGTDASSDITMLTLDGSEAGAATFNSAITGGGLLTTGGNIVIPDAGTIGSASDTDAIAIGSDGDVTLTQDLELQHDGAILSFGANDEVTLTHVHDTGILLNSTNVIQFNDASQNIGAPSNAILDINATDEIELNATLVDVNANLDVSGTYTGGGTMTTGGNIVIPDAGNIGSASDTDAIAIASDGVVTFSQVPVLPDNTVSTGDIQGDAITEAKIADDAVESEHLNNNVISGQTEISSGLADADELLYSDAGTLKKVGLDTLTTHVASGVTKPATYNGLINGAFTCWQRGTAFRSGDNNDDTCTASRWVLLSDGNDIVDVVRSDGDVDTSRYALGLDVETVDKKFGVVQIIENINCGQLGARGTTPVSLSFKAKVAGSGKLDNVKAAVISWTGTADSVTSDCVNAWNAEGTDPGLATNWTYENTPANLNVTTSWVRYKIENISMDTSSINNVAVFIWSDVTDTNAGDFLYITDVQLEPGETANPFTRETAGDTLAQCQRYYHRGMYAFMSSSATTLIYNINFPVEMRTTPTVSHEYAEGGTANDIYNIATAATPTFVPNGRFANPYGLRFAYDFDAGLTADDGYQAYFYFEAEL